MVRYQIGEETEPNTGTGTGTETHDTVSTQSGMVPVPERRVPVTRRHKYWHDTVPKGTVDIKQLSKTTNVSVRDGTGTGTEGTGDTEI